MFVVYSLCALIYLSVSAYLCISLTRPTPLKKIPILIALGLALIFHAIALYPNLMTDYGLNFNIFNSISLTGVFFLAFFLLFSLYRPILILGLLAAPTAFIALTLGYFGQVAYQPIDNITPLLSVHIILSFAAYCVLLMSAIQAIIFRLQIRELKHQTIHRFWVNKLPPLQSMESLLFDMILLGFVLLSFALCVGFLVTYDIIAQHIAHKLFFSALSWCVFGWLIFGHYKYGWGGKRASNMTIYGFLLLLVGFVGSKAVLELVLGK